jgi:hypothetical membrane protein
MSALLPQKPDHIRRSLAIAGAAGAIAFPLLVIVGGALYDGYSHMNQAISELGGANAPYAWLQSLNFVMLGLTTIALAGAIAIVFPGARRATLLVACFGLLSCIANAVFPCDAGCAGRTTIGFLHNLTGVVGFVSAIAGMLLLSRHWRRTSRWSAHARTTVVLAGIAVAALAAFLPMAVLDAPGAGVAQRIFVGALLLWLFLTALRLSREFPRETRAALAA